MRWISNVLFRLRAVLVWGKMQRELDEEMFFHLEKETQKYVVQGMSEEEARRQALRNFGVVQYQREQTYDSWGTRLVQDLKCDARQTMRQLARSPLFAVVAVFTLALGIGGATAVFSVVNGVLLKPLPHPDSHELVAVHHTMPGIGVYETPLSPALYFAFRDHSRTLRDIGLWRRTGVTVTGPSQPERLDAAQVTDGLLPLLGVEPMMGRGYAAEDVSPGSTYPVILSRGYWARRFGSDPSVVGQTIRVEGNDVAIIGVLAGELRLGNYAPELILPLVFSRAQIGVGNFSFPGVARLRPGVTAEEATRDLDRLTDAASEEYGGIPLSDLRSREFGTFVRPLKDDVVGEASTVIWLVFGTVGFVLLVACTNVANLFLVRAEGRQREVAMRTAMGASRGRLVRQFLTEALLVGLLGGTAGLVLAFGGIRLLLYLAPANLPRLEAITMDPAALLFALGISMLAGLSFGVIPIVRYGRDVLVESLKEGGPGLGMGRRRFRVQAAFAVSQVALALVLLIGSGLLVRSFQNLRRVPAGFQRPEQVLTFRLSVPASEAPAGIEAARTHHEVLSQIARIPGVTSASAAASVVMENWESWNTIEVEGFPVPEGEPAPQRRLNWITPKYFATIENPILAGRSLEWADILEQRPVAVVTENYAREYWGEPHNALGGRIRYSSSVPWREIVGVVGTVHVKGPAQAPPTVIYWPMLMDRFWGIRDFTIRDLRYAVRTTLPNPKSLLPQVRDAVRSVNPNVPLYEVLTLDEIEAASVARTSFTLVMLGIAAAIALVLGTVGVYGVISYVVAQRTREIGVRIAVGARSQDIRVLVLRQGGVLGLLGLLLGLAMAAGLTRLLSALLFGVSPFDAATFGVVSLALLGVVLLASYIPARRAAAVDPTEALRWQ